MSSNPLLHITTPGEWRSGLAAPTHPFLHLSTVDLVELPANALFHGRTDLLLLCIDPARLTAPLRWEPGNPDDPPAARFPHLYGVLDKHAVIGVVAYRCDGSGRFQRPAGVPAVDDPLARILAFEHHLARRTTERELPFPGGFGVRNDSFPASYEHNRLLASAAADPRVVLGAAEALLGDLDYRKLSVDPPAARPAVRAFREAGYRAFIETLLVADRRPDRGADPRIIVSTVDLDDLAAALRAGWVREIPGVGADVVTQLVERTRLTEAAVEVRHLAARAGTEWVAHADLHLDGATAQIDDVTTEPGHRGRGYARALVLAATEQARAAGCDLIFLRAAASDWPREFYARLGFSEVGRAVELHRGRP